MVDVHVWLLVIAAAAFVAQDTTAGPQLLASEPLVAGPVGGWLFGDVWAGTLIGVAAQLIWCGAVPAGTAIFLDVNVATLCAVAIAALASGSGDPLLVTALAMVWLIPVGLLGCGLTIVQRRIAAAIVDSIDGEKVTAAGVAGRHLSGWLLAGLRGAVTALVGVSLGLLVVPLAAELVAPFVRADLIWAGILGAGGGTAVGATWRHSRGRATLLGAATALGLWLIS